MLRVKILANNPLIDEVLSSSDIVDVIWKYVSLKRAWSNFSGCCPFHNEKTPSFMVSPTKQIFKCFGCGKGGNVITFMQEIERLDFRDAVKELANMQHIDLDKYQVNFQKISAENDEKAKLKRLHTLAHQFFVNHLQQNESAQKYLKENRKLTPEIIHHFALGYAPDKHYELIQMLRSKGFSDNDLLEASLAKKNTNGEIYAFFRNRITFPIFDAMGNVVAFSARVINPEDKPKYLNSAEHKAFEKSKILYGLNFAKNHIKEHQKLIIVEGQMDVLGLARLDFPIWVATSGTALSTDHIKLIKRYTENLYLLFDNDEAGNQATIRALKLFYQHDLYPKIIQLPEGFKDCDELANTQNGKSDFSTCLTNAQDGFLTIYHRLREKLDLTSPIDKQKLINTLFELIISVNNITIQEHYKQILAEKLGFAVEILDAQFKRFKTGDGRWLLFQQQKQIENQQADRYQMERDLLVATLFYQWAILQYLATYPKLEELISFVQLLSEADPENILAQTLKDTISPEKKEKINEFSLWRDNELEPHLEDEKKYQIIAKVLVPYLQNWLQWTLKKPSLSIALKQKLLESRKKI